MTVLVKYFFFKLSKFDFLQKNPKLTRSTYFLKFFLLKISFDISSKKLIIFMLKAENGFNNLNSFYIFIISFK